MKRGSLRPSDAQDEKPSAIKVVVRARPLNDKERSAQTSVVVSVSQTAVQVVNPVVFGDPTFQDAVSTAKEGDLSLCLSPAAIAAANLAGECRSFHFDRCFGAEDGDDVDRDSERPNQELIFQEVGQSVIDAAFQGFNCTLFAYGQTGSGKTHTMVGDKTDSGKGVIPRVCEALFREIDTRRDREATEEEKEEEKEAKRTIFSAHVSYCEIYKEKVNDLLDDAVPEKRRQSMVTTGAQNSGDEAAPTRRTLRVREHPVTGPFVEGLGSRSVTSYADIAEEMLAGEKLRTVASTLMNPVSSRSHAVFTITLTQTSFDPVSQCANDKTSKISMIDLAGSERANVSGTSGDRLKEGAMINKSLTTLGRVISALSKQATDRIPYRDSTLTWLLKESLGGNAKTTMFAMISPSSDNYDETMSTLRYAESAKKVMNRAVVNEDKNARIIRQLRQEIEELREQLARKEGSSGSLNAGLSASLEERESFYAELKKEVEFFRSQQKLLIATATPQAVHLNADLPSLVNMNTNMGSFEALAYVLVEGTTIFGTEPGPDMDEFETVGAKNDTQNSEEAKSPKENEDADKAKQKKRHGSWTSTMLRRRKSSSKSAPSTPTFKSRKAYTKLDPSAVALALSTDNNSVMQICKLQGGDESYVLPRHAQFTCSRIEQDNSTDGESDANKYTVMLESLDPTAMLMINGEPLEYGDDHKTKLHHGDQVRIGKVFCFRLHVPGCAITVPRIAEAVEQPVELELPKDDGLDLDAMVREANAICEKLVLNTEFAVEKDPANGENGVVVKKKLEANCCSTMRWDRTMLEMRLQVLREFSASLENVVSFPPIVVEEEILIDEEIPEQEPVSKVVSPRQPSMLTGKERTSSHATDKPNAGNAPEPYTKPRATPSLRLLGHGRIYLAAQSASTVVPLSVAIYDFSGGYIGKLDVELWGISSITHKQGVLSPRSAVSTHRIRVGLNKMEFDAGSSFDASGISITLKTTTCKSNANVDGKKAEGQGTAATDIFSTPKVPPAPTSDKDESHAEFDLTKKTFIIGEHFETTVTTKKEKLFSQRTAEEESLLVEIWGYDVTLVESQQANETQQVEFYVSVDVEEREGDGLYHPVAVKPDGALRLHANRSRRVMVRVTQSDQQPFALSEIMYVQIADPDAPSVNRTASMSRLMGKTTQRALPSSSRMLHGHDLPSGDSQTVGSARWQVLEFRGDCGVDDSSRSLNATLRWDRAPESDLEPINVPGARYTYRLAIAFKTRWSNVPIVVSKSLVAKVCGSNVSASQKLTRGLVSSRTVWWAKESFSRSYRLGTWYVADVVAANGEATPTATPNSVIESAIARHISGLHRLEVAMQLERVRQKVWISMNLRDSNQSEGGSSRVLADPLTTPKVNLCLKNLFDATDDEVHAFESVQFESPELFVRHLRRTDMLMNLSTGELVELSAVAGPSTDSTEDDTADEVPPANTQEHVVHFVSEPTQLVGGNQLGGEMSGFLMLSEASDLDEETAAAVVAPLGNNAATVSPRGKAGNQRTTKLHWQRQWFVLKRPFLYAYEDFTQKHQTGVMDLSMCQLIVAASPEIPFSFRLVCLDGRKQSAVWWLQASASTEMRAWIVAIDPVKIDARKAIVSTVPTAVPAPPLTA